jgi:putative transposase
MPAKRGRSTKTTEVLWDFSVRHVFVIIAHDSRRVVYAAVTSAPTLAWVKQQLREATAWGNTPRFLLHDNDGVFGQFRSGHRSSSLTGGQRRYRCALDLWLDQVLGVTGIPIPYGAPTANAHVERFLGNLRRECLQHFIFFSEAHLRRTVIEFVRYVNEARPHQGINNIPDGVAGRVPPRSPPLSGHARLVARPVLGGLAHDYDLAA